MAVRCAGVRVVAEAVVNKESVACESVERNRQLRATDRVTRTKQKYCIYAYVTIDLYNELRKKFLAVTNNEVCFLYVYTQARAHKMIKSQKVSLGLWLKIIKTRRLINVNFFYKL